MTHSIKHVTIKRQLLYLMLVCTLFWITSCKKNDPPPSPVLTITTVATGLVSPIGMEADRNGNVWVAQEGTGKNDGKVSIITTSGQKFDAIIGLESFITDIGEVEGPSHLLFTEGRLFILGAHGKMYKANVNSFRPGNIPLAASTLAVEDIGAFVLGYNFVNNAHDTHPYGITKGPDDAIYIADAAANAIIKRSRSGVLTVLAEVPGIPNPLPYGPPQIQSVPTGVIYDGQNFLVTAFLGFPFPAGKSLIYKISRAGAVSVYQQGFTSLVDLAEGGYYGHLVLEHGVFGPTGFTPNTGKLKWANGTASNELTTGLNLPAGLLQTNLHTWYVTSLGDNSVLKISY